MSDLKGIFDSLGLNRDNGLFMTSENKWKSETSFPNRVNRLIERKIVPDAFFCFSNKPLILFFENPQNKAELHKAIWNFNECPIAIIVENNSIEIFNGFNFLKNENALERLGGEDKLSDFKYFELVTGKTWEQYENNLNYKNRVDYHLLSNIKAARRVLVEQNKLNAKVTNALIGKCIFIRYLIDRKVKMRFDDRLRTWTNAEFCELFNSTKRVRQFFEYIEDNDKGFNGDLFPLSTTEYSKITKEDYSVLRRLLQGEDILNGQLSLFELYDFSIIPIEFISNVYELFIGQDNQKKEGAYYTPLFLVDYILKETVDKKLEANSASFNCKVLDPACGSGIFLVETLRKIIEKYIAETGIEIKSDKFKTAIKNLAKENIFGIDKDLSAIQVAVFSIYLTLLDYLEPPGIETFKFPVLFNTNFFESDFFDQNHTFNKSLKNIEFDFILGNPPWKGNGMDAVGNKYLKDRKKKEKLLDKKFEIAINNNEIAEGFMLRVSDFTSHSTQISFIIRSSSLYNLGYNEDNSPFRQYWLTEYFVDRVFELAPVRHELFEKSNQPAVAPAAVLFYRYANGQNTDLNEIEHIALKKSRFFSMFKIFAINRTDYKIVQQNRLKENDWLWKTLVYGSYLDFNFIKRIKDNFCSIKDTLSHSKTVIEGTGIKFGNVPTYDSKHLIGTPLIDTFGITSFFIIPTKVTKFERKKVDRLRDERLFKAPMLLIREGIDMDTLTAKCAVSRFDSVFKDSVTSIKALNKSGQPILNNTAAIFSSSLFSYFAINTFSSIGIERERVKNYNKYSLPYLDIEATPQVESIENLKNKVYKAEGEALINSYKIAELNQQIKEQIENLESKIYSKLEVSKLEKVLLDYSLTVNRPLIIGDDSQREELLKPLEFNSKYLLAYASFFTSRFKSNFKKKNKRFTVEIWHTNQIVGMLFKIKELNKEPEDEISWIDKKNSDKNLFKLITSISSNKITDRLFVQKDVRGFDNDFFYIFKPNEKKLWHEAIAYLDVTEFADAILKTGGRE